MDVKTYQKYIKILVIIIAILVSLSVSAGNGYLAVLVITIGILSKINLRKKLEMLLKTNLF